MLIKRQDAIDVIEQTGLSEDEKDTAIRVVENLPSAQQPYFIQLKNIVSNDEFRRILEDLKHQCKNIVLLHEYEQLVYPTQRWIPCSERLPDEDGEYLVTVVGRWEHPETELCYFDEGDKERPFCPTNGGTTYYRKTGYPVKMTIAWMPLPDPWKGGEQE